MTRIGCHLSDRNGFMGMAYEAAGLGCDSFQFFTRNPRGGRARTWDEADLEKFKAYATEHDMGPIVAYAPYTADPASMDMTKEDFARLVYAEDLARLEELGHQLYAAHPGSALGEDRDVAVNHTVSALNEVITRAQTTTFLLINMPGAGHEIGVTLEEMAQLIDGVKLQDHVGVCLDVVGLWGAGYDVKGDLDGVLEKVDKVIGMDRVRAVHLADPRYELGTHHTNHMPLGEGQLGMEALCAIGSHELLRDKVLIFETPHDDVGAYGEAVKALKAALA